MSVQEDVATGAPATQPRRRSLSVSNIEVIYDHVILVLKGVSLEVPEGGIVALLGANGAGKSTTLKAISRLLHAERGEVTKGTILFRGEAIEHLSPNQLVRRGVVQVMEGRHCFEHLTVEDNLMTGAYTRRDGAAAIAPTSNSSTAISRASGTAARPRPATSRAASSRWSRSAGR
jgi:branched-chain amino acid transport system ATP-binding protein